MTRNRIISLRELLQVGEMLSELASPSVVYYVIVEYLTLTDWPEGDSEFCFPRISLFPKPR